MAVAFGEHAVRALLQQDRMRHISVYVAQSKKADYSDMLSGLSPQISVCYEKDISKRFPGVRHQGIAAQFDFQWASLAEVSDGKRLLILDRIQDPHNFGACLRSAAAFGVSGVIIPERGSSPMTDVVHKVSCGGSVIVPIVKVNNLSQVIAELKDKGVWFIATAEDANSTLSQLPKDRALCVVMGSEGEGVRQKIFQACDYQVAIPTTQALSTLNVSVATGILLYELYQP